MPSPLTGFIANLLDEYGIASNKGHAAKNYIDSAGDYLRSGDTIDAGTALNNAAILLGDFISHFCYYKSYIYNAAYYRKQCWEWVDDNWPAAGEAFSMDLLLTEMLAANPSQLQKFIGIVDAYRVACWDAPYNEEFYAALARGFKQW